MSTRQNGVGYSTDRSGVEYKSQRLLGLFVFPSSRLRPENARASALAQSPRAPVYREVRTFFRLDWQEIAAPELCQSVNYKDRQHPLMGNEPLNVPHKRSGMRFRLPHRESCSTHTRTED